MAWEIHKINNNPLQVSVAVVNDDKTATPTTDYREADKLARKTITGAALNTKGYTLQMADKTVLTVLPKDVRIFDND